ncbi:MAG: disulfide bond formation protein B [Geminicoccaceae bacterium]
MVRKALILSALAAAGALLFAYVLQYGFGLEPCHLCWLQRYPYFAIIPVALIAAMAGWWRFGLVAVLMLFITDASIAWFHGGVEAGIFALPEGCSSSVTALTVDELRAQLASAPPTCDQVAFSFAGLSLSVWNAIFASAMSLVAAAALIRSFRS